MMNNFEGMGAIKGGRPDCLDVTTLRKVVEALNHLETNGSDPREAGGIAAALDVVQEMLKEVEAL